MKRIKYFFSIMILMAAFIFGSGVQANHVPSDEVITVKKGDTLYGLSKKHHVSVKEIKRLNLLENSTIYPGQRLLFKQEELFKIMTGSFTVKQHALNQANLLKKSGLTAAVNEAVINGDVHYRVQAGAYKDRKNAEKQLKAVKKLGFGDAYILTVLPLNIMGITSGDTFVDIEKHFGSAKKITNQNRTNSLYYQADGAGIITTFNDKGKIEIITIYPEYLNKRHFTAIPFTKKDVLKVFGDPTRTKEVSCYESASCEEIKYSLNGQELTVRVDRDGKTVQFLELRKL